MVYYKQNKKIIVSDLYIYICIYILNADKLGPVFYNIRRVNVGYEVSQL
jgi:hypothetical protein